MKKFFTLIMCTLICTMISSCGPHKADLSANSVDSDSIAQYVPTVQDVLNVRNDMIYQDKIDSIYLHMPEEIVICIVNEQSDGTYMTSNNIVEKYLATKARYDKIHDNVALYNKYKTMNIDSLLASKDSLKKENPKIVYKYIEKK